MGSDYRGQPYVHLLLENDRNAARYLARDGLNAPAAFTAQWNDDLHHCLHVLLTDGQVKTLPIDEI